MIDEEKQIVPQIILNDLKYLSVRQLYFNWFFSVGSEVATQLIDNTTKVYLQSTKRTDLIEKIRNWRGNETHNIVRIIKMLIKELSLDFDFTVHRDILKNLYKGYQNRYLDAIGKVGTFQILLSDLNTIDYTYKYFRDKINISSQAMEETIINKLFLKKQDLFWGENNVSLYSLFYEKNNHFKIT